MAYKQGIRPGDVIKEINGIPFTDWGQNAVTEYSSLEQEEQEYAIWIEEKRKVEFPLEKKTLVLQRGEEMFSATIPLYFKDTLHSFLTMRLVNGMFPETRHLSWKEHLLVIKKAFSKAYTSMGKIRVGGPPFPFLRWFHFFPAFASLSYDKNVISVHIFYLLIFLEVMTITLLCLQFLPFPPFLGGFLLLGILGKKGPRQITFFWKYMDFLFLLAVQIGFLGITFVHVY